MAVLKGKRTSGAALAIIAVLFPILVHFVLPGFVISKGDETETPLELSDQASEQQKEKLELTVLECRLVKSDSGEAVPSIKFRVRNNSELVFDKIVVQILFMSTEGGIASEKVVTVVGQDGVRTQLQPHQFVKYPGGKKSMVLEKKLASWKEGEVKLNIIEATTVPDQEKSPE